VFVFDTNHLRELCYRGPARDKLLAKMALVDLPVVLNIVSVEESLRGWLARIAALRSLEEQVGAYQELDQLLNEIMSFVRLPWDEDASHRFDALRRSGIRIGTMDLKIACITLEHDAVLVTRNLRDFAKVPGLKVENWLD
jgi:tRNA(fMet)-specific endonuclease VapC